MRNPFKTLDKHAGLMNAMGAATDADLSDAALDGRLSPEAYRKALTACTHCKSVDTCLSWLDAHADDRTAEPPAFCANRKLLETIKAGRA